MDIEKTIRALTGRGFAVRHFATGREAADYLDGAIDGTTVGIGGSKTIDQIGLYDRLARHNTVWWHWRTPGFDTLDHALTAPVYLSSANAITEDGHRSRRNRSVHHRVYDNGYLLPHGCVYGCESHRPHGCAHVYVHGCLHVHAEQDCHSHL